MASSETPICAVCGRSFDHTDSASGWRTQSATGKFWCPLHWPSPIFLGGGRLLDQGLERLRARYEQLASVRAQAVRELDEYLADGYQLDALALWAQDELNPQALIELGGHIE